MATDDVDTDPTPKLGDMIVNSGELLHISADGRLWASAGQRSLEAARVLLIGCDATGCQALKNLVLPGRHYIVDKLIAGIAHFTVLSPRSVEAQDVATNFFLHPDTIGRNIAEEAVK